MDISLEQIKLDALTFPIGMLHPSRTDQFKNQIGQTVINLTDINFNEDELDLLSKGLSFCPTPGAPIIPELWLEFKQFQRKLELKEFFWGNRNKKDNKTDKCHKDLQNKSDWRPTSKQIPEIGSLTRSAKMTLLNYVVKPQMKNLTPTQYKLIKTLRSNPQITIQKADKGSAVVILYTSDYLTVLLH